jgi:hypothetical protein
MIIDTEENSGKNAELTHSILKCPRLQEVIMELEELFSEFQILHDFTEVKGISPKEHHLNSISKKLSTLRAEVKDYLVAKGLAVLKPPLWGKDNDPTEWWNINNFEILSACYQHEVEIFLKIVTLYFPNVVAAFIGIMNASIPRKVRQWHELIYSCFQKSWPCEIFKKIVAQHTFKLYLVQFFVELHDSFFECQLSINLEVPTT